MISPQFSFWKTINHPLLDILKELHSSKIPYDSDPPEAISLSQSFSIPNVDKGIIQQASESMIESSFVGVK